MPKAIQNASCEKTLLDWWCAIFLAQAQNISNLLPKSNIYIDSEDDEILVLSELCGFRPLQRDPQKRLMIMAASNSYNFLNKVDATTVVNFPTHAISRCSKTRRNDNTLGQAR